MDISRRKTLQIIAEGEGRGRAGAGEGGGDDGVVDGKDEGEADLEVVPRGAALGRGGGVHEHPRHGDPERDGVRRKGEGEEEEVGVEAEVGSEAGGRRGGEGRVGEVEAQEG